MDLKPGVGVVQGRMTHHDLSTCLTVWQQIRF